MTCDNNNVIDSKLYNILFSILGQVRINTEPNELVDGESGSVT